MRSALFISFFLLSLNYGQAQLVINEVCASNSISWKDEDFEASDWIELYNCSENDIALLNWGLSDRNGALPKWKFQQGTIPAKGYLIVFASDKNRQSATHPHTNFKIGQGEEAVYLFHPQGQIVNQTDNRFIPTDHTIGRTPDGSSTLFHLATPTPGAHNNEADIAVDVETTRLTFSHEAGVYSEAFQLVINTDDNNAVIRYTLDGSEPTRNSPLYERPIEISNQTESTPVLADIVTSDSWEPPHGSINKATVVRVKAFIDNQPVSFCHTHTYFVDTDFAMRYRFPVFSLSTKSDNFFAEDKGIYVAGNGEWPNYTHTGDEWERPVYAEYFSNTGERIFEQNLGARVHGRSSRAYPQKSIRLCADEKYGNAIMNFPFFGSDGPDSFRRLILRTPDRMFSQSYFVDPLTYTITKEMDLDAQDNEPVIVFINGEYWGIHQMRERLDQFYLAKHYNVHPDKVDILDFDRQLVAVEGNMDAWDALASFVAQHDLSLTENYNYLQSQVDINNLLDYLIAQLFFANKDFPINNQKLWREQKADAKWRFFYFDGDDSMNEHHFNPLAYYMSGKNYGDPLSILFSALLANEDFRAQFSARFVHHLSTTFEPSRIVDITKEFEQAYLPMVNEHIRRWNSPDNFHEWQQAVQDVKYFAIQRCAELTVQLQSMMADPFIIYPNPAREAVTVTMADKTIDSDLSVAIHDIFGKCIVPAQTSSFASSLTLNMDELADGVYFLYIKTGRLFYTRRLIKG